MALVKILKLPEPLRANLPVIQEWDATEIGLSAAVNPGVTVQSSILDLTGMRRYRLKIVQLTGAGPTAVNFLDLPLNRVIANAFENVVLAAAMVTGVRTVFNFGEGTAILTNFMGCFGCVQLTNNGGNAATYEVEFFAQG